MQQFFYPLNLYGQNLFIWIPWIQFLYLHVELYYHFPFFLIPIIRFDWCIVNKKKFAKYAFIGSILYLISSIADFVGLLYISASLERAILFTFPIYVLLLSSDLKRLTAYQVMLIIFTVLGLAVMFNPTLNNDINDIVIGGLLVFVSAVFWAIFIIYSKKVVTNISPVIFTSSYMCIII